MYGQLGEMTTYNLLIDEHVIDNATTVLSPNLFFQLGTTRINKLYRILL